MGNRPQGNKIGYLVSMIVFALLMLIMMVRLLTLTFRFLSSIWLTGVYKKKCQRRVASL